VPNGAPQHIDREHPLVRSGGRQIARVPINL